MSIAALDIGRRGIGIAIAPSNVATVHPLTALQRRSVAGDIQVLGRLFAEHNIVRVIVGLPLNMDGSAGPMAAMAREFGRRLERALHIPVELYDERLTSFEAEERLRAMRVGRKERKGAVDAMAAAIILESWLNAAADRPR